MSDSALIGLLAKPENIRCALDISNAIDDLKKQLRLDFWEQMAEDLQKGLIRNALSDKWTVQGIDRFREQTALNNDDEGVFVVSSESRQAKTHLQIGAWQKTRKNRRLIFYGIAFSEAQPGPHPPDVDALKKSLPQNEAGEWWIGGSWVDIDTNSDDFLCRIAEDRVATSRQVTDPLIKLLQENLNLIQAADHALSNFQPVT